LAVVSREQSEGQDVGGSKLSWRGGSVGPSSILVSLEAWHSAQSTHSLQD
jgi:hypothetical protein